MKKVIQAISENKKQVVKLNQKPRDNEKPKTANHLLKGQK